MKPSSSSTRVKARRSARIERRRKTRALLATLAFSAEPARADPSQPAADEGAVTVTVPGTGLAEHSSADPSAASTVIRGERLHEAGQTAASVLARVPGVAVERGGAPSDLATASIRGSDSSQVPVYVAGVRVNDDVTGTADLSTIPLWMMDRVEVFRGNAPASAEQLGLGGAIFFWPRLPKTNRVGAGAHVGSFGESGEQVAGEVGGPRAGALVAVRRDRADNDYRYTNDEGLRFTPVEHDDVRKNADFTSWDAWAIGRYRYSSRGGISSVANAFDREQGVTGLGVTPALSARSHTRRLLGAVAGDYSCPGGACRVEAQSSILVGELTLTDPFVELPSLRTPLLHTDGTRATERVGARFDVGEQLELGASVTQVFEGTHTDREGNLPRHGTRSTTRPAVNAEWSPWDAVRLFGLGAVECDTTAGVDEQYNLATSRSSGGCGVLEPAGRLGVSVRPLPPLELLANAGRYVRPPTLSELYGASALTAGNPTLSTETGETVDAGFRFSATGAAGRYAADVFGFLREAHDLIRFRQTGLSIVAPYNVGRARILGLEATLAGEWARMVRAELSTTLLDPRDTTDDPVAAPQTNDVLPLMSRFVSVARVDVFTTRGLHALRQDRASIGLSYLHRSSRYDDAAGQVVLPPQDSVDIEASSEHLTGALELRLAIRNVFDERQFDLLGLPLPGRSFHTEIVAWW